MSYYRNCLPSQLTDDQKNQALVYLTTHPGLAFLQNGIEPPCNNDIAEIGYIYKYCQYSTPNPDVTPIKDMQLDMRNEVTGWEGNTKKTNSNGEYRHFGNDYSNLSYVTIEPKTSHPFINMILVDSTALPPQKYLQYGRHIKDWEACP